MYYGIGKQLLEVWFEVLLKENITHLSLSDTNLTKIDIIIQIHTQQIIILDVEGEIQNDEM